jgi:hypothetical protein
MEELDVSAIKSIFEKGGSSHKDTIIVGPAMTDDKDDEKDDTGNAKKSHKAHAEWRTPERSSHSTSGVQSRAYGGRRASMPSSSGKKEDDLNRSNHERRYLKKLQENLGLMSPGSFAEKRKIFSGNIQKVIAPLQDEAKIKEQVEILDCNDRTIERPKDSDSLRDNLGLIPGTFSGAKKTFEKHRTTIDASKISDALAAKLATKQSMSDSRHSINHDTRNRKIDGCNLKDELNMNSGLLIEKERLSSKRNKNQTDLTEYMKTSSNGNDQTLNARIQVGGLSLKSVVPKLKTPSSSKNILNVANTESLVQSTILKEMQTLKSLQSKAQVNTLIQQFSTVDEGGKNEAAGEMKLKTMSSRKPSPQLNDAGEILPLDDEAAEEDVSICDFESIVTEEDMSLPVEDGDDDYSYEEVTETENENGDYNESTSMMGTSHTSFYLMSPVNQKMVILDFEGMELAPKVKQQHLKVIADLETLMKKLRSEKETEKQRQMKEKMLRDLLVTERDLSSKGTSQVSFNLSDESDKAASEKAPPKQQKKAIEEMFRNQYDLSKDEMADIVAHLTLCEETGEAIRWDLINRIIYQGDDITLQKSSSGVDSEDDVRSSFVDLFDDNESKVSSFSIYPEFDDCASEITYDREDFKKSRKAKKDATLSRTSRPNLRRTISDGSENDRNNMLLRRRVNALRASRIASMHDKKANIFFQTRHQSAGKLARITSSDNMSF